MYGTSVYLSKGNWNNTDKRVTVLGLGHQVFHCNKSGNE
jgi:hypothetical protein